MQFLLGEEYQAFRSCLDQPPAAGLRLNTLKISREAFEAIAPFPLGEPVSWCPEGFWLPDEPRSAPGAHPLHAAGLYYLQDPAAMSAVAALDPQPGERVLDLSAAPGGKSTHIAARLAGRGVLVANEIHPQRAWDLAENLERFGVRNALILNETPERLATRFGPIFDRVLLDAPCSGEGMFRKSAAARAAWTPGLVQGCALRQRNILALAAQMVRPGGRLVYTTCTFAPEENEDVIHAFLAQASDFTLFSRPLGFGVGENGIARLYPHHHNGDGHFVAVLQRGAEAIASPLRSHSTSSSLTPAPRKADKKDGEEEWRKFLAQSLNFDTPQAHLHLQGSYLYAAPPEMPDWSGLKTLHPGWWLGEIKTGRFEPSQALALGLQTSEAAQTLTLAADDPLLRAYLSGATLPAAGCAGWMLIAVRCGEHSFPLGWGRASQGIVKNHYPKGLRRF